MCYDISFEVNVRELEDYFPGLIFDDQIEMEFGPIDHAQGVAVFGRYPIIYINMQDMLTHCKLMEWGIIEYYSKEEPHFSRRNSMLNIRSERVLDDKTSYWHKIRTRRCLIPVTGIFEHRAVKGWKKKVPYWIKPCEQQVFFLPGLYSVAKLPDKTTGEMIERWTFGMITRAANALMRNIHNDGDNRHRMPLFLPLELSKEFLSDDLTEQRYKELLSYEMPAEDLDYRTVYTIRTPKLRADDQSKSALWEWENLPALGELNPD